MKIKEVIAMLNEYAKVAGDDCEVQCEGLRLQGKMVDDYSQRYVAYGADRKKVPGYFIVIDTYARPPMYGEPMNTEGPC